MFKEKFGIIVSCDVDTLEALNSIVGPTIALDFIQGFKIGMNLALRYGLPRVVQCIRTHGDLPIIYDHQKFGTDIPDLCAGRILHLIKSSGVDALIAFPQSGIETLRKLVPACEESNLTLMVGGEMTHKGFLAGDGGFITDEAPVRIYREAASMGVRHFILPGNKPQAARDYKCLIEKIASEPRFLFPGIGRAQGGDIISAFETTIPHASYAIVGRSIYEAPDKRLAAEELWQSVDRNLNLRATP